MRIRTVTLNPAFDLHWYLERLEIGKESYVQSLRCDAGGKGINISRALNTCGAENMAYVMLGKENGAAFAAQLERDGVAYQAICTEGRVRENVTLHPQNAAETRISTDLFSITPEDLERLASTLRTDLCTGDLVAFAGRLPRGIEKESVIVLLQELIARGARLIVDSNSFTPEDLQRIHPWLIKPNEEEIVQFLQGSVRNLRDAADAAAELVGKGIAEEVMISLGGDGAVWSNGERRLAFRVPRIVKPVSTVGAGDSTLAGLLAATARGEDRQSALCYALSCGTAACMTEGTNPPKVEDIQAVFGQIRVTEL